MRGRVMGLVALTVLAVAGPAAPVVAAPPTGKAEGTPAVVNAGSCTELRNNRAALARSGAKRVACVQRVPDRQAKGAKSGKKPGKLPGFCEPVSTEWTVPARKVACRSSKWFLNVHDSRTWAIIGRVTMREVENVSALAVGAAWTHDYRLEWERAVGEVAGAWVKGAFTCRGECSTISGSIPATLVDRPVTVSTTGHFISTVFSGVATGFSEMEMSFHPGGAGIPSGFGDSSPTLRCDAIILPEGCVFPHQIPVFALSARGSPNGEFIQHVAKALHSTHLGMIPGRPLTRTMDQSLINRNRAKACPWWVPRPEGKSCDEYPFASTREGAAAWPDGTGRTWLGCAMDHLPLGYVDQGDGWSACMIDKRQNSWGGYAIGEFYGRERILDGDQFLVFVF